MVRRFSTSRSRATSNADRALASCSLQTSISVFFCVFTQQSCRITRVKESHKLGVYFSPTRAVNIQQGYHALNNRGPVRSGGYAGAFFSAVTPCGRLGSATATALGAMLISRSRVMLRPSRR